MSPTSSTLLEMTFTGEESEVHGVNGFDLVNFEIQVTSDSGGVDFTMIDQKQIGSAGMPAHVGIGLNLAQVEQLHAFLGFLLKK